MQGRSALGSGAARRILRGSDGMKRKFKEMRCVGVSKRGAGKYAEIWRLTCGANFFHTELANSSTLQLSGSRPSQINLEPTT